MLAGGTRMNLAKTSAVSLSYLKSVTSQTHVAVTGQKLSRAELFALAKQIEQDPSVAYAEIDEIAHALFTPTDPDYQSQQWHYQAPATYPGGANLRTAWDLSTGAGVVVAVIDAGIRPHADLAAKLLPGYDFISADSPGVFTTANDGDGRDSDLSDPGDWTLAGACNSSSPACQRQQLARYPCGRHHRRCDQQWLGRGRRGIWRKGAAGARARCLRRLHL